MKQTFSSLPLQDTLLTNLASLNFDSMTPIQAESLPLMLNNEDVIAKADTGTGKTVAFGLCLLNKLHVEFFAVQALILCPTRELADQVSQALRRLARLMPNVKILNLSGGAALRPQLDSLRHGAHIIVGTPGRVQKHLEKSSLSLNHLQTLVLDEADRMLDMGFLEDIQNIMTFCPKRRQTLLFSATYSDDIKKLSRQFLHHPKEVFVKAQDDALDIEQIFYEVQKNNEKFAILKALLRHYQTGSTLIFCNTKQLTTELADSLNQSGFSAIALNGDMEQIERDVAMIRFSNKSCSILVATDVAARGLDIKELPLVINYELAFEHDVHIHRIGRTGRAGNKGLALSITTPADVLRIGAIEEALSQPVTWGKRDELQNTSGNNLPPDKVTLCLAAGKKDKIRPGDILGALTKDAGLPGDAIGKIDITPLYSYVAIQHDYADKAYRYFQNGKLKGRKVHVRKQGNPANRQDKPAR